MYQWDFKTIEPKRHYQYNKKQVQRSITSGKIKLSEKKKELILKHFGHSQKSNEDVYQTPPGLLQIANTGQKFPEIHKQTKTQAVIGKFNIPFVFFVADV